MNPHYVVRLDKYLVLDVLRFETDSLMRSKQSTGCRVELPHKPKALLHS